MDAAASRATDRHAIRLPRPDDFEFWRDAARALVQRKVPPDRVVWLEPDATGDLFGAEETSQPPAAPADAAQPRVSKRFLGMAKNAALHSDPGRFALLYRLLWAHQRNPRVMEDGADPDVRTLAELDKAVRRDSHKMHAFVRFRQIDDPDGTERYVAWFEPDHHIVRANAGFFVRRFTT